MRIGSIMEPSCSQHDCKGELVSAPFSMCTETKTDNKTEDEAIGFENIATNVLIDEIERKDFEEENRLINPCPQATQDAPQASSSSQIFENISSGNSIRVSSSETSLILNTNEPALRFYIPEKQSQLSDIKKTTTPENCMKKNHVYTMNFTPPKPTRPSCIPKYKLFLDEKTSNEREQASSSSNNQNNCDINKDQDIESKPDSPRQICLDDQNGISLLNNYQRLSDKSNQTVDHLNDNSDADVKLNKESIESTEETKQGASCELNLQKLSLPDDSAPPSMTLSNISFSDHEDPDSGEVDEEETTCTCLSSRPLEDDKCEAGDKKKLEEEVTVLDSEETEQCLPDENLRLLRKRKMESPPNHSTKKLHDDLETADELEHPPEVRNWLTRFTSWSGSERLRAIDLLIGHCAADQVRHMMKAIEPLFQCDFISLLPRELALAVLGYLEPPDLLRAARTCKRWRYLADDDLLWKDKCKRIGIFALPKRLRFRPMCINKWNTWKAAFMRQNYIDKIWRKKSTASPKILKGHDDHVITCLQFHGNRILSGSDDTTLKLWSANTGRWLRTLIGHTGGVWSSQMRGRTVISGSTDRTLRIWDAGTGASLHTLTGHTSTVRCMHLFNDKVVSGSRDATLRVWSVPDGKCLRVLVGHMAAVRCVQYNGKLVISGAYDYFVKVWNPDTGECIHTLAGHTDRVYSLQFDGHFVISGSLDTSIMVWDVESGALKHTLTGHQSITSGMELRSNILMSGNADSTVKVWDIKSGQCLHTLAGQNKHQSAVTCVQSNSRFVITSSDDGTVKLWDLKSGEFIRNLVTLPSGGSGGVVWRIRASRTKLVCAVGSRNGTEETKLMVLNFDTPGTCRKCEIL